MKIKRKSIEKNLICGMLLGFMAFKAIAPETAFAALPWEGPLEELQSSITGPVAKIITVIVVCVSGMMIAMGDGGAVSRLALRLIFGLSLAFGFMQIISMF